MTSTRLVPVRGAGSRLYGFSAAVAAAIAAICIGLLVPTAGDAITSDTDTGVIAGVALIFLAATPLVLRLRVNGLDGPAFYAIATCFFLGFTSLAWLGEPDRPGPGLTQADIADALRVVALGLACFAIGAFLVDRSRPTSTAEFPRQSAPTAGVLATVYLVSFISVMVTFSLGAYGYISSSEGRASVASFGAVLSLLSSLGDIVVLVTALCYFRFRDRKLLLLLIAITMAEFGTSFVSGNKKFAILPLALNVIAYGMIRRRLPRKAVIGVAALLLLIIVPINQSYRAGVRGAGQSPSEALSVAVKTPLTGNPADIASNAGQYLFSRFRSIDSVALIRTQTPSPFQFAGGRLYYFLPAIVLIPRAVWPGKPVLDSAGQFTNTYGQRSSSIQSATQITNVGDLYRNFGLPGVVIGMALWGAAIAWLTRLFVRRRSPRMEAIYLFALASVIVYTDADLPSLLATASKTLPFVVLVAWFLLPGRDSGPGYRRLVHRHRPAFVGRTRPSP